MSDAVGDAFFAELRVLVEASFPKQCSNCGKIYQDNAEFLHETQMIKRNKGIKSVVDDDDRNVLELYRNCSCGSTLMDIYQDRRDSSEMGIKRRQQFEALIMKLQNEGIAEHTAREELLNIVNGRGSEFLQQVKWQQ